MAIVSHLKEEIMKLKRTSLLFNNSLKKEIKKDPCLQRSLGMQEALNFVHKVLMCNFEMPNCNFQFTNQDSVQKLLNVGNAESQWLRTAIGKSTRISSELHMVFNGFINVDIYFFEFQKMIFEVNIVFDIHTGKSGSLGLTIPN